MRLRQAKTRAIAKAQTVVRSRRRHGRKLDPRQLADAFAVYARTHRPDEVRRNLASWLVERYSDELSVARATELAEALQIRPRPYSPASAVRYVTEELEKHGRVDAAKVVAATRAGVAREHAERLFAGASRSPAQMFRELFGASETKELAKQFPRRRPLHWRAPIEECLNVAHWRSALAGALQHDTPVLAALKDELRGQLADSPAKRGIVARLRNRWHS